MKRVGAKTPTIARGSPREHGCCESFNGRRRDERLAGVTFATLAEARVLVGRWRRHCNEARPHSALGYRRRKRPWGWRRASARGRRRSCAG